MDAERRDPANGRLRILVEVLQSDYRRLAARNHEDIDSVRKRVTWLLTFNIVVLFALGAITFYLRGQDQQRASEAKQIAFGIQQNRVTQCVRDNQRHAKLEGLLAASRKRAKTKAQRAQIDLFVNLIAEKRDCSSLLIPR